MKKNFALLIALALAATLGIAACSGQTTTNETAAGSEAAAGSETTATEDEPMVGLANPWTEYATLEEAEEAAGFEISVPASVKGYDDILIQVMKAAKTDDNGNKTGENDVILEYRFMNDTDDVNIRKSPGSEDISGVYGDYTIVDEEVNGVEVDVSTDDTLSYVATWTVDGYSYSVYASAGMARDALLDIVAQVA